MYADDVTHSGPDEDGTFDSDDELVFMARFLGDRKPKSTKLPKSITKVSLANLMTHHAGLM